VSSGRESFSISGSTLARNFPATMALVREILLEPRWDSVQFDLAKQRVANQLRQQSASPTALAGNAFSRLVYGDHIMALNPLGTPESVASITIADLQDYYRRALVPNDAAFLVAGSVDMDGIRAALGPIATDWAAGDVSFPTPPAWSPDRAGLYFLDVPGSAQSVLYIGYLAMPESDPAYWPATVMNFRLGGGGFASDLTQVLREQKGYTYGIGSSFRGGVAPGPFVISSSVRSNATFEALDLIKGIVETLGPAFDDEDLEATKSFLLKNNAMAFETLGAKLGMLRDMSDYGFPTDYVLQREAIVREMTIDRIRELAAQYLDTGNMVWLVVGDAASQRARLSALGLGTPVLIDRDGRRLREKVR
jgi:zinc protease